MPVLASLSRWNAMGHADRRGNGGPSAPAVQHKAPPTHRSARPLAKIPSVASTRAAASARSTRLPVLVRSGYDFAVAAWRDAGTRSAARRWLLLVRRGDAIGATRPLPRRAGRQPTSEHLTAVRPSERASTPRLASQCRSWGVASTPPRGPRLPLSWANAHLARAGGRPAGGSASQVAGLYLSGRARSTTRCSFLSSVRNEALASRATASDIASGSSSDGCRARRSAARRAMARSIGTTTAPASSRNASTVVSVPCCSGRTIVSA